MIKKISLEDTPLHRLFILAVLGAGAAQAADPSHDAVWGALSFNTGPSSDPVLWRGAGRPQHFCDTLNINVLTGKWLFGFDQSMCGAATFDAFDRSDSLLSLGYRASKNNTVGLLLETHFALNNVPGLDPNARTLKSPITDTWLTFSHSLRKEKNVTRVYGGLRMTGKEPVFSPVGTSKPYRVAFVGAFFTQPLPKGFVFNARGEIYMNASFNKDQLVLNPSISHKIPHTRAILGIESVLRYNAGIRPWQLPKNIPQHPQRVAVFISLPFGQARL